MTVRDWDQHLIYSVLLAILISLGASGFEQIEHGTGPDPAASLTLQYEVPFQDTVTAIAFSPDGALLALATGFRSLQLRESRTGTLIKTLEQIEGQSINQRIHSLAFSPDGKLLMSTGDLIRAGGLIGGEVRLWNVSSGTLARAIRVSDGLGRYTKCGVFGHRGRTVLVASVAVYQKAGQAGTTHVSEIFEWSAGGTFERTLLKTEPGLLSIALSPDGKILATGDSDGIGLWDPTNGERKRTLTGNGGRGSLSFSANGTKLASCIGPDVLLAPRNPRVARMTQIWDVDRGLLGSIATLHQGMLTAVALSPDGIYMATGDQATGAEGSQGKLTATIKVWRVDLEHIRLTDPSMVRDVGRRHYHHLLPHQSDRMGPDPAFW